MLIAYIDVVFLWVCIFTILQRPTLCHKVEGITMVLRILFFPI